MTQEKEAFLDRWSRLKQQKVVDEPPPVPSAEAKAEQPAAPLPPVEELQPESDFRPFMDPRVDTETRRSALKKLFSDAHFNVPDPFEAYSEDYTLGEPIPEEMMKTLNQVKRVVFDEPEKKLAEAPAQHQQQAAPEPQAQPTEPDDVAGKQDA